MPILPVADLMSLRRSEACPQGATVAISTPQDKQPPSLDRGRQGDHAPTNRMAAYGHRAVSARRQPFTATSRPLLIPPCSFRRLPRRTILRRKTFAGFAGALSIRLACCFFRSGFGCGRRPRRVGPPPPVTSRLLFVERAS